MSTQQYEMKMRVVREMFHNSESMFGIYAVVPVEYNTELARNGFNNVSIQGNTRPLAEDGEYTIKFEGTHSHPTYGEYYKIIEVEPDKLESVTDQDKFLSAIVTPNQLKSLKDAYPDGLLVDMIIEDKIDVNRTKGIKSHTLSLIKEKVLQNTKIAVLISKLVELGLTTNAIDKLLAHFGTPEDVIEAIEKDIYNLCDVPQFGFLTVDKTALGRGDNPTNNKRIRACINFLLKKDNQSGHTWSQLESLIEESTTMLNVSRHIVEYEVEELKKSKRYYIEGSRIAYSYVRNQEILVYSHLKRIRDNYVQPHVHNVKEKIKRVEKGQGFEFTDEQSFAITDGAKHGVIMINGLAGGGKSALVSGLIKALDEPHYITCALSGAAVRVLDLRGVTAATIHRTLGYKNGGFTRDELQPLSYDIVIVDEISMVAVPLFLSVIRAVKDGAQLIISGDSGQLSGIGFGNIIRDLLETQAFPSYGLTKVHRQAAASGILEIANRIRAGEQVLPYNSSGSSTYGELKDMTVLSYNNKDSIPYDIISIASDYKSNKIKTPQDLIDFQVIVPNRDRGNLSVRSMNIELQRVFNDISKHGIKRHGYTFLEGDKVIAQGNSYEMPCYKSENDYFLNSYKEKEEKSEKELESLYISEHDGYEPDYYNAPEEDEKLKRVDIFNGTMGYIEKIIDKIALVNFIGVDGLIPFDYEAFEKLDMGYAITTHRSQGSSIPNVIFAIDFGAYTLLSRQLVYVGLTRASVKCVLLCENNALYQAISNDESGNRRTFLQDIIRNDISGKDVVPAFDLSLLNE